MTDAPRCPRCGEDRLVEFDRVSGRWFCQVCAGLFVESQAQRRLADEYDAAQQRGEVRQNGERTYSSVEKVGPADIGLSPKEIHEARKIRDAEQADPGIVWALMPRCRSRAFL